MSSLSRRSMLKAGSGTLAAIAGSAAVGLNSSTSARAASGTALYTSPTNSRLGETITVPTPGAAKYPIFFSSPDQLAAYTRMSHLTETTPLLLGHRAGYLPDGPWPESALESAQNILATTPSTMVEIDLRMTADGKCISMHDSTIDRETTGTGEVLKLNSSYLLQQNLVNNLGQTTQLKVREVWEFFQWGIPAGAVLWLDVKNATPEFVVDMIRQYKAESQVIVSAYGLANLTKYMKLAPELVYFVPKNAGLELETIQEIRKVGDIDRIIGFANYYVPDMEDSLQMHRWNAPTLIELNRYDADLPAANLDQQIYKRAIAAGFRAISTNQYQAVATILGVTGWGPLPKVHIRKGRGKRK